MFTYGDRVVRTGAPVHYTPTNGTLGTVASDQVGSAEVRVLWDGDHQVHSSHPGYVAAWAPKKKEVGSLRSKVIEFLSQPERSDADSWFKWLGDSVFFSMTEAQVEHFISQLINGELSGYPDFCPAGKEKFVLFLGDLAPQRKKWVAKTMTFKELRHLFFNTKNRVDIRFVDSEFDVRQFDAGSFLADWIKNAPSTFSPVPVKVKVYE